jgi:predicted dehydrogenase
MSPRVGVVGARRVVQGIGGYVARAFSAAGCEVVGVVGTSLASVNAARDELAAAYGIEAAGFLDVAAMLDELRPDVLAICSPTREHRPALAAALEARVHVLCDKPLWWEARSARTSRATLAAEVRTLATGFADAGRRLELNTQWPETLACYRRLHPHAEDGGVRRVEMLLSPITTGTAMIVDAAPHLLSLLHATLGRGEVRDASVSGLRGEDSDVLDVRFRYRHAAGEAEAALALRRCAQPPRPAGYALNGCWAERQVSLPDYRMTLAADGRSEPLDDPLDAKVAGFVARVAAGEPTDVEGLVESLAHLRDLVGAAKLQRAGARRDRPEHP